MAPVPKDSHLSILRYSPECVEGKFSEVGLPLYGDLGSSFSPRPRNVCRNVWGTSAVEWHCLRRNKATGTRSQPDEPPHFCMVGLVAVGGVRGAYRARPLARLHYR